MSDLEFRRFKSILKTSGHFVTKPRMRLFGLLQNQPSLSLKELINMASRHDQSTVYRNIELFEKLGIIHLVRLGWHSRIELTDKFRHHHHHMTCLSCGKVIVVKEDAVIESEIRRLSKVAGFKIQDHQLEIRGLCKVCTKT